MAIIITAWAAFLRKQEIRHLQLCDVTWLEEKALFNIRKTKNNQRGVLRVTPFFYGEGGEACLLTRVREYVVTMHGSKEWHPGCTRAAKPGWPCKTCPPLFPAIVTSGVKATTVTDTELPRLIKDVCREMEDAGEVDEEWHKQISVSSTRRGGNTVAAIAGIRETLRQKHGRWLSTAVREYDSVGTGESAQVTKALGKKVHEAVEAYSGRLNAKKRGA